MAQPQTPRGAACRHGTLDSRESRICCPRLRPLSRRVQSIRDLASTNLHELPASSIRNDAHSDEATREDRKARCRKLLESPPRLAWCRPPARNTPGAHSGIVAEQEDRVCLCGGFANRPQHGFGAPMVEGLRKLGFRRRRDLPAGQIPGLAGAATHGDHRVVGHQPVRGQEIANGHGCRAPGRAFRADRYPRVRDGSSSTLRGAAGEGASKAWRSPDGPIMASGRHGSIEFPAIDQAHAEGFLPQRRSVGVAALAILAALS